MEIIIKGSPESRVPWIGECSHCGSVAKAEQRELKDIQFCVKEHDSWCWGKCPVCKKGTSKGGGMIFRPDPDGEREKKIKGDT